MKKIVGFISKTIGFITQVFLVFMVIIISYQVFDRFILKETPSWSEEISLVILIWFGLLGAALGVKEKAHLNVSFFVDSLNRKMQIAIKVLSFLCIALFSFYMITSGVRLVGMTRAQTLPATGIPVSLSYLALPISGFFILLYLIVNFINDLKSSSGKKKEQEIQISNLQ